MSMKIISEYVDFEIDLDEWDDDELIEEIKGRGYEVVKEDPIEKVLSPEELEALRGAIQDSEPGSLLYSVYEKIRKR